jgi:hypothetical protein
MIIEVRRIRGSARKRDLGVGLGVSKKHIALFVWRIAIAARSACGHGRSSAMVSRSVLGELAAILGWLETEGLVLRLITGVQHTTFAADEQPAGTSPNGFEKVQWVHGINQGPYAVPSTLVCRLAVAVEIGHFTLVGEGVRLPREGPEMKYTEYSHLTVDHQLREPNLEIVHSHFISRCDSAIRD